jgi:hypothetical protein
MGLRAFGIVVVAALGVLWATSGTQRERPVLAGANPDHLRDHVAACEANAAAHPADAEATRALAQAYLDAAQPGLAVGALEGAPASTRDDPRTRHLYARALLDQGRNDDALAAETTVVASCMPPLDGAPRLGEHPAVATTAGSPDSPDRGCDALLLGAAVRRAAILRELVSLGVEDTLAHPEASFVAYQNATREARVTVF